MLWLACYNPKINWKIGEVKMTRCPEEYRKAVETESGKTRVAKAERRREEKKKKKEVKVKKEKIKEK